MNSSRRALQTNGNVTNFELVFELLAENQKICKRKARRGILIKVQCVIYIISMDSSRQALQINGKLFFKNFGIIFRINYIF